ncbi:MAG: glycine--tRNA ligase subunit beta [Candidatus Aminicenantes bacterium]|nr:glycine--tRNA ligase subunit beta [Candidatus Aminicenantes bacterium]
MAEFLFELGVEEVPVSYIKDIMDQLVKGFTDSFTQKRIEFGAIETAMTNRRFLLFFNNISPVSGAKSDQVKGPSKKIAYDEDQNPTKALEKFLEINGIKESDLEEIETKKGIYLGFTREDKGDDTKALLRELIPGILEKMSFNKTMTWNSSGKSFVRPIRNLLAIFNGITIDFQFAGVTSSDITNGHRLLSEEKIRLSSFQEYCEQMSQNFVIFSEDERKDKILTEIKDLEEDLGFKVQMTDNMLEYYIFNNEYPVVFAGQFDEQYLDLPSEIISTFMINEKKLVPVYDSNEKLTNTFAGVSNVPDESEFVSKGNEKVIRATFEDAKFFWDNDRNDDFEALREGLKNVMFQKDLGTFHEKSIRIKEISELVSELSGNSEQTKNIGAAAELCKNDLLTRMVGEFPSLQGIMGGLYLKEKGIEKDIWETVYYHYEPKGFVEDELESLNAGILSIGDKIDNIVGLISRGTKVSSSKDPYGIRRDTSAIIKIVIDFKLNFDLKSVVEFTIDKFGIDEAGRQKIFEVISSLFSARMEHFLKDLLFIENDVVNSVIKSNTLFIYKIYMRAKAVFEVSESSSIHHLIEVHKRVRNIIKDSEILPVSESFLVEPEEKILFEIINETKSGTEKLLRDNKYIEACSNFIDMKPVVDNFFEKVLVMDKNEDIRKNRIGLLQKLNELLLQIADFSIITEKD